jgi:hypothetical protein
MNVNDTFTGSAEFARWWEEHKPKKPWYMRFNNDEGLSRFAFLSGMEYQMKRQVSRDRIVIDFFAVWDKWLTEHPEALKNYDSYDLMNALGKLRLNYVPKE